MRVDFSPKQWLYHQHCAKRQNLKTGTFEYDVSHTLFGGAAGGGKSYAIGASAITAATEEPGSVIAIVRWQLDDLLRTTQEVFLQFVCPMGGELWNELGVEFNKNKGVMTLRNTAKGDIPPSTIHWLGLKSAGGGDTGAINRLLSTQWSRVYIDEAHEIPKKVAQIIPSRVRLQRKGVKYKLGVKYASNPAPNWLRKKFVILGKSYEEPYSKRPGHLFIPSFIKDNQDNLPPNYESFFSDMPETLRRRFLMGDWSAFEGQVWPGGVTDEHCVPEVDVSLLVKRQDWDFIQAVDPGLKDPTAATWAAYNFELDLLIFLKDYEEKWSTVDDHALNFKTQEEEWNMGVDRPIRLIDPDAAKEHLATAHTGNTVKSLFADNDLFYLSAQNDTASKTLTMAKRLKFDPNRIHPVTGKPGCPGVLFSSHKEEHLDPTHRLRMSIMNTTWTDDKEKWENTDKHLVDCATYTTNYVATKMAAGENTIHNDVYDLGGFRRYETHTKTKTPFYGR